MTRRLTGIKVKCRSYKYVLIYLKSSLIIIKGKMPGYSREAKQNSMKEHLYQYLTNRIFSTTLLGIKTVPFSLILGSFPLAKKGGGEPWE